MKNAMRPCVEVGQRCLASHWCTLALEQHRGRKLSPLSLDMLLTFWLGLRCIDAGKTWDAVVILEAAYTAGFDSFRGQILLYGLGPYLPLARLERC